MQYYNKNIADKVPYLYKYFYEGIINNDKNIGHCLLFTGADTTIQCELALEIARLLNCKDNKEIDCNCLNCQWINEGTHPAIKIYTRLDFKPSKADSADGDSTGDESKGTKSISIEQARNIIAELTVSSDYKRVFIFCDRDKDGNLLPLNKLNFPDTTANAMLKTFEEPPKDTTFIFLSSDKSDMISTVVSRCQTFFVPSEVSTELDYSDILDVVGNYYEIQKNDFGKLLDKLFELLKDYDAIDVLKKFEYYILSLIKSNVENKNMFYRFQDDLKYVETAIRQLSMVPAMQTQVVIENLVYNLIIK